MTQLKESWRCQNVDCSNVATHGIKYNTHCDLHKEKEMVLTLKDDDYYKIPLYNLKNKYTHCIYRGCENAASYNFLSRSIKFCDTHKLTGMVNVVEKKRDNESECGYEMTSQKCCFKDNEKWSEIAPILKLYLAKQS